MSLRMTVPALVVGAVLMFSGVTAFTQQKQDPNFQNAPQNVVDSAKTKAVFDLELACRLIAYGRKEKNADSMLLAAQIMHKIPTEPMKVGNAVDGPKNAPAATNKAWGSPKDLVAEAKKMGTGQHIDALVAATEKMLQESTRGAVGGPQIDAFTIGAGQTIRWNPVTFKANEKAVVFIDIGVNARMTLEVSDQNGIVVARDNVPGDYFSCTWYPKWQGPFTFRLINQDTISFHCGMATN